jgi:hypothetical protein
LYGAGVRRSTVVFILAALCLLGFAVVTRRYGGDETPPPTVSANPTSMTAGGSVMVSWSWPSWGQGPSTEDWIGIYVPGSTAINSVVSAMYISSCYQTPADLGATAKASGSCSFTVPTTPGTYQFRLFSGSTLMATSKNITVTASA